MSTTQATPTPPSTLTVDDAIENIGLGRFQRRLLGLNGFIWASGAMEVLAVGLVIPSIIATFALSPGQAGWVSSSFFAGMMVGAWGFGVLADRIGRRDVFFWSVIVNGVLVFISAFAPSFGLLLALRFLTGVAVGGAMPVNYALMAEYLPRRSRGPFLVYLEGFWAIGTILIALLAWAVLPNTGDDGWRWLFALNALPAVLAVWIKPWIPESPRYLLLQNREAEARTTLERIARFNGTPVTLGQLRASARTTRNATAALFGSALLRRTVLLSLMWFGLSFGYYGVFTWLRPILVARGVPVVASYWYTVVLALAQVPGYLLAAYWLERLGRRTTLAIFLFASAAASMAFAFATSPAAIIAATLFQSFALLGAWGALYAYTPESYPTEVRATGTGWASAMARVAGIVAGLLGGFLLELSFPLALAVYAASLALAGGATLLMRQNLTGKPLEDSLTASPAMAD